MYLTLKPSRASNMEAIRRAVYCEDPPAGRGMIIGVVDSTGSEVLYEFFTVSEGDASDPNLCNVSAMEDNEREAHRLTPRINERIPTPYPQGLLYAV